jgi:hypothetical protein
MLTPWSWLVWGKYLLTILISGMELICTRYMKYCTVLDIKKIPQIDVDGNWDYIHGIKHTNYTCTVSHALHMQMHWMVQTLYIINGRQCGIKLASMASCYGSTLPEHKHCFRNYFSLFHHSDSPDIKHQCLIHHGYLAYLHSMYFNLPETAIIFCQDGISHITQKLPNCSKLSPLCDSWSRTTSTWRDS